MAPFGSGMVSGSIGRAVDRAIRRRQNKHVHYFDHHTASPLRPGVLEQMHHAASLGANPSSVHQLGRAARRALEVARGHLRALVGAQPQDADVVLCGSMAEARSLSILGLARAKRGAAQGAKRDGVVLDQSLHAACPGLVQALVHEGFAVCVVDAQDAYAPCAPPLVCLTAFGSNASDAPRRLLPAEVGVVAVSALSAEGSSLIGVEGDSWVHKASATLVVDAQTAAGQVPLQMALHHIDVIVLDSPPLGGPAGMACLVVRKDLSMQPLWDGGGQNKGQRSGTEALALVVGMGEAARQALVAGPNEQARYAAWRALLDASVEGLVLPKGCASLVLCPVPAAKLTGCIKQFDAQQICAGWTPSTKPGKNPSLRLSMGHTTTADDVAHLIRVLRQILTDDRTQ